MEFGIALERAKHRNHRVDLRNHADKRFDIHIQHVVVQSEIQMVPSRCTVHGCELQLSRVADKAHLFQHQRSVADINLSAEIISRLVEHFRLFDFRVQHKVNTLRYKERTIAVILRCFGSGLCWCLFRTGISREEFHQLVYIRMFGNKVQLANQRIAILQPFTDIAHFTREREIGVAELNLRGGNIEHAVGVFEIHLRHRDMLREGSYIHFGLVHIELQTRVPLQQDILIFFLGVRVISGLCLDCELISCHQYILSYCCIHRFRANSSSKAWSRFESSRTTEFSLQFRLLQVRSDIVVAGLQVVERHLGIDNRNIGRVLCVQLGICREMRIHDLGADGIHIGHQLTCGCQIDIRIDNWHRLEHIT